MTHYKNQDTMNYLPSTPISLGSDGHVGSIDPPDGNDELLDLETLQEHPQKNSLTIQNPRKYLTIVPIRLFCLILLGLIIGIFIHALLRHIPFNLFHNTSATMRTLAVIRERDLIGRP